MYKRILLAAAVAAVGNLAGATEATFVNASGAPWQLERCGLLADGGLGAPDGTVIHLRALSVTRLDLWGPGAHGYRLLDPSGRRLCSIVGGRAGASGAPGLVLGSHLTGEVVGRFLLQESPLVLKIRAKVSLGPAPDAAGGPVAATVSSSMAGSAHKPVRIDRKAGAPTHLSGWIRSMEAYEREVRRNLQAVRAANEAVEAGAPVAGPAPCGPMTPELLRWHVLAVGKEKEGSCLLALQHVQAEKTRFFKNGAARGRVFASPWGKAVLRDCAARGKRAGEESRLRKAEGLAMREIATAEFMLELGRQWVAGLRVELDAFEARRMLSAPEVNPRSFPAADTLLRDLGHLPPNLEPMAASLWMDYMALDQELGIQLARARTLAGDAPAPRAVSAGGAPD